MGYDAKRVIQTTGMILRPSFYRPQAIDRPARLAELGLDAAQPTGLVMFGGNGSNEMLKIAKELSYRQLILVAGHNTGLAKKLEALPSLTKHVVLGFTKDINQFMQLSDYFMGKPGPGSLSEAVHMGLPVITFQNSLTMPQERYNTLWVKEKKLGKIIKSVKELQVAVDELLHDLSAFKSNVQKINNRAVYEVVDAMSDILGAQNQAGAL
jgi:UDP-N-acetylglucosamine:LPS N-acetylglucosamine transferase